MSEIYSIQCGPTYRTVCWYYYYRTVCWYYYYYRTVCWSYLQDSVPVLLAGSIDASNR